jgi:hypothetical protein
MAEMFQQFYPDATESVAASFTAARTRHWPRPGDLSPRRRCGLTYRKAEDPGGSSSGSYEDLLTR